MAQREVTATSKDESGEITMLAGPWGTRTRTQAVIDIRNLQYDYVVTGPDGTLALKNVKDADDVEHIRTEEDLSKPDVLQTLPDI